MKYILLLSIFLVGCSSPSSRKVAAKHPLTLRDLKFADYEKAGLALNHVDTVFLVCPRNGNRRNDTLGYDVYDGKGNLQFIKAENFMSTTVILKYDSLNFVIERKEISCEIFTQNVTYHFSADSLMLYQIWDRDLDHVSIFRFNSSGSLLRKDEVREAGAKYHVTYQYGANDKLLVVNEQFSGFLDVTQVYDEIYSLSASTRFYYCNEKLDSIVTMKYKRDKSLKATQITYFNNKGLKWKEVYNDTIKILYIYKT